MSTPHLDRVLAGRRPAARAPDVLFTTFRRDELHLIAELACTLNEKPGKNWVEAEGGLPDYICRIARAIKRSGRTTSQAVAIAVSRVKKWAAGGGDVDADTRAKAARALAQWEKLKAKAKTHRAVRASYLVTGEPVLALAAEYNTDIVRSAWERQARAARQAWYASNPTGSYDDAPATPYVKELWNTYLVTQSGYGDGAQLHKVDYTVDDNGADVTFGDPVPVKVEYVTITDADTGGEITDADLQQLLAASAAADHIDAGAANLLAGFSAMGTSCADTGSALNRLFVKLAADAKKPYGDVRYADPGYQSDGKKRYPIDTEDHIRAAWSYINQQSNAAKYSAAQLKAIKGRIKAAARRHGIQISD